MSLAIVNDTPERVEDALATISCLVRGMLSRVNSSIRVDIERSTSGDVIINPPGVILLSQTFIDRNDRISYEDIARIAYDRLYDTLQAERAALADAARRLAHAKEKEAEQLRRLCARRERRRSQYNAKIKAARIARAGRWRPPTRDRNHDIYKARMSGKTFIDIGNQFGLSVSRAREVYLEFGRKLDSERMRAAESFSRGEVIDLGGQDGLWITSTPESLHCEIELGIG
jgi:hypothetical protein